MIKNNELLKKFGDDFILGKGKLAFEQSMKLFESLWYEGISLGVLPPKEQLEGIDVDINIAKILNSCSKSSCPE